MTDASEDAALILSAQAGDDQAFAGLVARHHPMLLRRLRRWVDADTAQDVAQEALLAAWRMMGRCDPSFGFAGWISTIAVRLAWRHRARQRRFTNLTDDHAAEAGPEATVDDDAERAVLRQRIEAALDTLDAEQRQWFALRYELGMPVAEMAAHLDCSTNTMHVRLHRLRRLLAVRLGDHHPEEP